MQIKYTPINLLNDTYKVIGRFLRRLLWAVDLLVCNACTLLAKWKQPASCQLMLIYFDVSTEKILDEEKFYLRRKNIRLELRVQQNNCSKAYRFKDQKHTTCANNTEQFVTTANAFSRFQFSLSFSYSLRSRCCSCKIILQVRWWRTTEKENNSAVKLLHRKMTSTDCSFLDCCKNLRPSNDQHKLNKLNKFSLHKIFTA